MQNFDVSTERASQRGYAILYIIFPDNTYDEKAKTKAVYFTFTHWVKVYDAQHDLFIASDQKPFIALVDRILAANAYTDTSAFESQIDALVYRALGDFKREH